MTVSTTSAAFYITPVIFKTFFNHISTKGRKLKDGDTQPEATDDVFFDQAFHIVKSFIEMGTQNTVESLQAFTNTHVPAPYWAAVSPVLIPLASCNRAADLLINWFGPEELKHVVGGEKWWQVRGLDGVDSEWVTEKEYLGPPVQNPDRKLTTEEANILRMDHLDTVMLYVHGGGYFWGSINTHRYQIIRYARKIKGRAFAVNYRKAPQYPWPCPLHDVLAAYFYLTSPPPGALHTPIPPSKIVMAGDSAGGGLCLAALTVLRDMGLEQPAGAVLISPWVDLTHSFPSVMKNTSTDIIPPHGFIHRASPIWPIHPLPPDGESRVMPTRSNPPPAPGHADTLKPSKERVESQVEQQIEKSAEEQRPVGGGDLEDEQVQSQHEMLEEHHDEKEDVTPSGDKPRRPNPDITEDDPEYDEMLSIYEPKPPKVLMDDPDATPLELRSQIQIYAMNEQLTHPLVSPILQGSLGNLCPLYILAGDGEVLRDEIVYMAHKAANPKEYPTRKGVLREAVRQKENAEKFQKPTKVHLQVFDGMCHVLTVFTFTDSAKYAYRSIAEFVKHVTTHSAEHLDRNPFPEFHIPPQEIPDDLDSDEEERPRRPKAKQGNRQGSRFASFFKRGHGTAPPPIDSEVVRTDVDLYRQNEEAAKEEHKIGETQTVADNGDAHPAAPSPSSSDKGKDIPGVTMIRERVNVFGQVRHMEPKEEIEALNIPARHVGIIKEEPVKRWLEGQEEWDKKYRKYALQAIHDREHYEKKFSALIDRARAQGLELVHDERQGPSQYRARRASTVSQHSMISLGEVVSDRRYGPFDLEEEMPPPSAIVGRRDNRESIALIKKCIYFTAPATHRTVPKRTTSDAVRAAFDADDNPINPPKQSASEQQTESHILPVHGLRIWQDLITFFMKKSTAQSSKNKRRRSMPNLRTASGHGHPAARDRSRGESSKRSS